MPARSAVLIVVDVQEYFVTPESCHVVPTIAGLTDRWLKHGGDVLFTQYVNYPDSPFERLIGWTQMHNSPQVDIVPELQPFLDRVQVLRKTIYSAFSDEGSALIRDRGWSDIYICGIDTESCVLKTAADAFERNLTPWVIEDASASHNGQRGHEAGIYVASRFLGPRQIIRAADVHPEHLLAGNHDAA